MIPQGWKNTTLNAITDPAASIRYGVVQIGPHTLDGVPIVAIKYINQIASAPLHRASTKIEGLYKNSRVQGGDVLLSVKGTIGEVGIVPRDFNGNIAREIARIRPSGNVRADYLAYQLQAPETQSRIKTLTVGTTRLEFSIAAVKKFEILLPPLPEQRRIAEILSTWDRAIETVEALIANARAQKKALLQSLLIGKYRLPGFQGDWKEMSLDELFVFRRGQGLSKDAVTPDGVRPCILYGELYTRYPEVIKQVIGRTNANDGFPSKAGDILIPASTTTSGIDLANATALLEPDVLLSGDINVLRAKDERQSAQFFAYMLTHIMKFKIASRAQGITIVHLYGSDLKPLKVTIPDFDEQHAIASVILAADEEIDSLGSQLTALRHEKSALMQQLLTGKRRVKVDESEAA